MSEITRQKLGKRIRYLREEGGLSLRTFSLMVGLDRSYLIDIEYGRRNLSIDNLEKISKGLEVSLSELLDSCDNTAAESG